jgi:hypothetical protein
MKTRQECWFDPRRWGWGGSVLVCTALVLMVPANTFGQSGRATISGSVSDPTSAVVPGAKIVITHIDTGQSREAVTVDNGTYVVPLLLPGNYKATCSREGFKTETRTGIVLTADDKITVDFSLTLGEATQTVEVSVGADLINTTTGALGQVIDQKAMIELPLNGRNPAELVFLAPGAVDGLKTGQFSRQYYTTFPTETASSVNGGRQGSTYYMLDGGTNMDNYHNNASPFPNPDATQEFRVLSNNFDAQYGFSPGAVVSIVTKSGTNAWHGDVFEFLRNEKFNARDFFSSSRDLLKRNQFGASAGGNIVSDKLFIFGNYQGTTLRRSVASGGTAGFVPNNKMISGDFSDVCTNAGGNIDSGTGICSEAGGQLRDPDTGQPVPFNRFDPARFSPVSMNFINNTMPRTDDPRGATPFTGRVNIQDYHEFTMKPDWYVTQNHHISGRVYFNDFKAPSFDGNGNMIIADRSWTARYENYGGNWLWTVRPNLLNNFVFSYGRLNTFSQPGFKTKDGGPVCGKCMGMNIEEYPDTPPNLILWTNGFWATQNTNYINRHNIALSESISWTKGKHTVVGGLDMVYHYWDLGTDWLADPLMGFDGRFSGSDFSDFLLGKMSYFEQGSGEFNKVNGTLWAPYIQDSIKLKPNLTLNLGLRWEPYIAYKPSVGRIPAFRPGQQSSRYPSAPVGLVYPGDSGVGDGGTRNTYNNFSPRMSIAWQPKALPNTSIRAAFGIFIAPLSMSTYNHAGDVAPFAPTYPIDPGTIGDRPIPFEDPWSVYAPTGGVSPVPPFATAGYAPPQNEAFFILPVTLGESFPEDYRLARNQTWNLSVEHQFSSNILFRVAYVGSQTYGLANLLQRNPGIYPSAERLTYPDFGSILQYVSVGTASYNAMQLTFEKRFSSGLQFTSNYSWSKNLDNTAPGVGVFGGQFSNPYDFRFDRGISSINYPHIWTNNWVYQTPALKQHNAAVRGILGDWQISGIWRFQSGDPFSISGGGGNPSGTNIGGERADLTGEPLNVHQGTKTQWIQEYFNTGAFTRTAPGTFGNSPRNLIEGPGMNVCDLGVSKNFPFKERYRVQFRWEMFNAFNRPHFSNPTNNPASSAFGQITSTKGYGGGAGGGNEQSVFGVGARVMQFALKFHW